MTPELSALIKSRVGEDVDTTNLAVFETIALNTKPLPGKRGSLFENAVVEPITLKEMVDSINAGNHLPLIADHELFGAPKGRFFHAGLDYEDGGLTMRALFYLDATEATTITKLNAGSLDEVSVAFLSREFLCSECGWDYFGLGASSDHIYDHECANGHKIGVGDTHGRMIGLNQFIELSLVARGAADKPKIIGKSQSKLAPDGLKKLAANGFETDELVVQASLGNKEEHDMTDVTTILTGQVATLSAEKGGLQANLSAAERDRDAARGEVTTLKAERDTALGQVATLTAERDELAKRPEATVAAEQAEAVSFLHEQLDNLMVAKGETKLEGDKRLTKVADLKAKINELTANLTSILPVGGKAAPAGGAKDETAKLSFNPAAFSTRK